MNVPVYECPDCELVPDPPWTNQEHCNSEWYCGLRQQYHADQAELGLPQTVYRLGPGHYVRQVMKADRLAIEAERRRRAGRY